MPKLVIFDSISLSSSTWKGHRPYQQPACFLMNVMFNCFNSYKTAIWLCYLFVVIMKKEKEPFMMDSLFRHITVNILYRAVHIISWSSLQWFFLLLKMKLRQLGNFSYVEMGKDKRGNYFPPLDSCFTLFMLFFSQFLFLSPWCCGCCRLFMALLSATFLLYLTTLSPI